MDIRTLLRANLKSRKGAFVGIALLMMVISLLLTMIFSLKHNVKKSIDDAYIDQNIGTMMLNIDSQKVTDELLQKVKDHELVDHIETSQAILMRSHDICGKHSNENWLIVGLSDYVKRQFNDDFTAYEDEVHPLSNQGIYLTQGIATNTGCKTGDKIDFTTRAGSYSYTIEGFVVEPVCGASTIGWKTVYVSPEAYDEMASLVEQNPIPDMVGMVTIVYVYKVYSCDLTDGQFAQKINQDTGISNYAYASETSAQMKYYTFIFTDICSSIMMVFAAILIVAVMIIMVHNISMTIEMSYVELGILKAIGFTKTRIRILLALQYFLAQIVGAVVGILLAIPVVAKFGGLFQPITAILAKNDIAFYPSVPVILGIILVSAIFIVLLTGRVGKVSPVKALTGERKDVYFDSLLNAPVTGKNLSLSLAYRQFSSNKRRYISAILIFAVLSFFMLSINLMSSVMESKNALLAMGANFYEVTVRKNEGVFTEEEMQEIEETVKETAETDRSVFIRSEYLSINGDKIMCHVYSDPSARNVLKGRAPIYDNEIMITEILADLMNLKIGDTVEVAYQDHAEEFIISGFYAHISDVGKVFSMSKKGADRLGMADFMWYGACLVNSSDADKVGKALEEKFGDSMTISADSNWQDDEDMATIKIATDAMRYTSFVLSAIFVLVVVSMICSKVFTQERRDLGIFKAIGFTSGKLRFLFAIRFLIVGILGSVLGIVLSLFFSGKLLTALLRSMGVSNFVSRYNVESILIPVIILLGFSFLFAFLVSRKVKNVEIRELVIE